MTEKTLRNILFTDFHNFFAFCFLILFSLTLFGVLVLSYYGKIDPLSGLEKTFLGFDGIIMAILGFYFGHRGVERAENERDEAKRDMNKANEDKIESQETRNTIEHALKTDKDRLYKYVREIEWKKFVEQKSLDIKIIPRHWTIPESEFTKEHIDFINDFKLKWETQTTEGEEGITDPGVSPQE